jgi:tetratricopeptide (TPR) repeat protein
MKDADAWFQQGMHHVGMSFSADYRSELIGDLEDALAAFDHALAAQPEHVEALEQRAITLARLDRHDEAVDAFARVIRLRPQQTELWLLSARSLSALSRHHEALAACNEVLARRAHDAEALYLRATALDALDRGQEALGAWETFLREPDNRSLYVHRGRAQLARAAGLAKAGRHADAVAAYREILEQAPIGPNDDFPQALQSVEAAREAYAAFLAARANEPANWLRAGQAFMRAGRVEDAHHAYATAARLAPQDADAWWGLAEALVRAGRREESIAMFDEALRAKPGYLGPQARRKAVLREIARARDADDSKRPSVHR